MKEHLRIVASSLLIFFGGSGVLGIMSAALNPPKNVEPLGVIVVAAAFVTSVASLLFGMKLLRDMRAQ